LAEFALKANISVKAKEKHLADLKQSSTESPSLAAMNPLFGYGYSSNHPYDGASIAGSDLTTRSLSTGIRKNGKSYIVVNAQEMVATSTPHTASGMS
jgi:hypothetical protein